MIHTAALLGFEGLARVLPPSALYGLARWAAIAALPINERDRATARANIQRLRPRSTPEELDRAAARVLREEFYSFVDAALMPRLSPETLLRERLQIEGMAHLQAALHAKRGLVLAGAHLSNSELPFQAFKALGVEALTVVEPLRDRRRMRTMQRLRQSRGLRFVHSDMGGIRDAVARLQAGGVVAILCDRDIQGRGICVPLAGRLARFPTGAVDLALRTGATLLPALVVRRRLDRFRVILLEPEPLIRADNRQQEVRANLARLIARIEPLLREHAEQWRVFESPWKACHDPGAPDPHGGGAPARSSPLPPL